MFFFNLKIKSINRSLASLIKKKTEKAQRELIENKTEGSSQQKLASIVAPN